MSARYPRQAAGLRLREAGGAWVIQDAARGRVHYLSASGALALALCTGEVEWPAIVELVCAATGAPAATRADVEAVLQRAAEEGLIA